MSQKKEFPVPEIQAKGGDQRVQLGIDLTFCPQDWLPDATNKRVRFTAKIYTFKEESGEWEYKGEAGEKRAIKFSFKDVSKEPGICMNFPAINQANENPDLFFPDDGYNAGKFAFSDDETDGGKPCPTEIEKPNDNAAHNHHYKTATTTGDVSEATIEVRCEDYGAYGTLHASAPDCKTLEPRGGAVCSEREGPNDVKIPRDSNGNNIADSAHHDNGGAAATQDGDNNPFGDGTQGDGLTNYEEYRGFIVKIGGGKGHTRTRIDRKDIFIHDRDGLGTGYFSESGLEIHFIPGAEYYGGDSPDDPPVGNLRTSSPRAAGDSTQVINFNSGYAHGGNQHGLRLVTENLQAAARTVSGFTFATDGKNPGPPGNINRIAINRAHINTRGIAHKLEKTIAHELGHAVCIKHHGPLTKDHNHEVNPIGQGQSDHQKGVTSGDNSCVMRYDNVFTYWCSHYYVKFLKAPCIHTIYDPRNNGREALPHPLTFCDSDTGTGVNNQANCGCTNIAKLGNCKSQIRVKDW